MVKQATIPRTADGMKDVALYTIRQEAGRWVIRPSSGFSAVMVGMFGFGAALMIYFSTIFFRTPGASSATRWIGAAFILVAAYSAWLGITAWRTRHTPLIIEADGRVTYGDEELCEPKSVASIRIAPARGGETGDCEVCFELAGGRLVWIPSQYFGAGRARKYVRPFAAQIAEMLGVGVKE